MIVRETVPIPARHNILRIAVIRALHLGDFLLAVPAFRSLRAGFPRAEISLIALPWSRPFVDRFHRYLDRHVEYVGYPGLGEVEMDPARVRQFLDEQRDYAYDLVVQMHGSGDSSLPFALALGGRLTAGYYSGRRPTDLTIGRPYPADQPEVLRNLGLAHMLGCPDTGTDLDFPLLDEDREGLVRAVPRLARYPRPWFGLHPGARPDARRWPPEYFGRVGTELLERYGGTIFVTGGPGEDETVREVRQRVGGRSVNLAGRTSLGSLAALISMLDLYISNDTGPAHMAVALDTPSITIFGPADHRRWSPLDAERHPVVRHPVACSPCTHWTCPIDHRCLRRLRPEVVLEAVERLLSSEVAA